MKPSRMDGKGRIDIQDYRERLMESLILEFGGRLCYVGSQGSYARGEATPCSDVDIMAVLDELKMEDLDRYKTLLQRMPYKAESCGFICGKEDLAHWNPCEIAALIGETQDWYGRLAELVPVYTRKDIRVHIQTEVGNLYHMICHRYIHEGDAYQALPAGYKTVFYILQNWYFLRTERFVRTKAELLACLKGDNRQVLQTAMAFQAAEQPDFTEAFSLLLRWCQQMLRGIGSLK